MCVRQPSHVTGKEFITQLCSYQKGIGQSCKCLISLRSKRFQSSYCAKVRAGEKKVEGGGGGEKITCK